MPNFIDRIVKRSIDRVTNKSHTISLSTPSSNWQLLKGYFSLNSATNYNLSKLLKAFEENPLVFEVIDNISQNVSTLPFYVEDSNGNRVKNPEITDLVNISLLYQVTASWSTCGNAFLYLRKGIGSGYELEFWIASCVTIICNKSTGAITQYQYTDELTGIVTTVQGDELSQVLHLKDPRVTSFGDVKLGLSKLTPMWDVVESSKEKFTAEKSIFKNRGIAGILSNKSEMPLLPEERKRQQDEFDRNTSGSDKFNKLYVTPNDVNFIQLGMSPTDLKLLEGIVESLRRLCSAYQLSSVLFNDVANSKFDNMNEAIKQAFIKSYIPTAKKIIEPISVWLSEELNIDEYLKIDKTLIEVIRSSTNVVAQALNSLPTKAQERVIENMTQQEVRELAMLGALTNGQEVIGASSNTSQNNSET